ncbi:subtilisin-like protein, partial [Eremomyces bilateralis CBS 781.70]
GYSAKLDDQTVELVRRQDEIASIGRSNSVQRRDITVEGGRGWNAVRLSLRTYNGAYNSGPWTHDDYLGQSVTIYVLDTGINIQHPGFQGSEVRFGANMVSRSNNNDNHGHGTMCAGVIAGKANGLSPRATTIAVKIASDQNVSQTDDVVAGIEWVLRQPGDNNMKVISMSHYGFSGVPDVSTAVAAAIRAGVHFVVCAGNDQRDSCQVQPANAVGVISVGSVNGYNALPKKPDEAQGTNIGKCVTIFAPGSRVPSLSTHNINSRYQYYSWGTSVAAPQVAALIANRLSALGPQTPADMKKWLEETATKDQIIGDLGGSPNLIAFNG